MVDLPMMGGAGIPDATSYYPAAPKPTGGLGGLGGFLAQPAVNDALQATFMSMMSSPRNHMLRDMPQLYANIQQGRRASEQDAQAQAKSEQERQALKSALVAGGISDGEADMLSHNPSAAKVRLNQVAAERLAQQRNDFISGLPPIGGYEAPAAPVDPAADQGATDSWGVLRQQYGWQVPTQGEATGDFVQPPQVAQAAPQGMPMSPNVQNLMHQRQRYVDAMIQAPDEASRKFLEGRIGQLDKMLEQAQGTDTQRNLQWRAREAGLIPGTKAYQDFILTGGKDGVTVNNIMGGGKFEEEFAKSDGTALAEISQAGMASQRNIARIDRLESLLQAVPTGATANFKQIAANYGVRLGDDVDNIQAAQALINALVPEQRPPGSGPMSDADLELFKQSLPRIINQPGGNQMIINTMRGIAQYDAEGAVIVQRLRRGEIDRAQAFDLLQSRDNPLADLDDILKPDQQQGGGTNTTSTGVPWSIEE